MENTTGNLNLTDDQADVLEHALSDFIEKFGAHAADIIVNDPILKQAGENMLARVDEAVSLRNLMHEIWPWTNDDNEVEGDPDEEEA